MSEKKIPHSLVRVTDREEEGSWSHPLNPHSMMHGVSLSQSAGMERLGVHVIRVPPGKESNCYHSHTCEEEFMFILSGRGIAEVDDREFEVGPGDFMGFSTPSVGHHLKNPFDEDLVYLVGGERKEAEIARFPRLNKHVIRVGGRADTVDSDRLEPFWPPEE